MQPPQAVDKLNNTVPLSRGYTTAAKLPFSSNCSVPNVGIAMVASSSYEKKLSRRFLTWTNCLASARCVQQFPVVPAPEGGGGGEDPLDGGETILRIESDFFFLCTPSSLQTDAGRLHLIASWNSGIWEEEGKKIPYLPTNKNNFCLRRSPDRGTLNVILVGVATLIFGKVDNLAKQVVENSEIWNHVNFHIYVTSTFAKNDFKMFLFFICPSKRP